MVYDCLIVGGGATGLYCALNLNPGFKVLIISKSELNLSNSSLAQGGIAAVLDRETDDFSSHIEDTLRAGGDKNDLQSVEMVVEEAPCNVTELLHFGVEFDRIADGEFDKTLEGGHSRPRILHHKDSTGKEIVDKLMLQVKKRKNIEIAENTYLSRMISADGGFAAELFRGNDRREVFAPRCIIATGGIGRIYEYTTNSAISTGDGIVCAYLLGAKIQNMNLIQFHPTAFAAKPGRERFLISEALRGEGARLLNSKFEQFMQNYDDRGELAPRDVVSKSMLKEEKRQKNNLFYLNISHEDSKKLQARFPMIYENCIKEGVDITRDNIPVYPCQHYLMGGIDVDLNGRTSIENLFAAGECSHTGVHGSNRLASNSLLEAIVYAKKVADYINNDYNPGVKISKCYFDNPISGGEVGEGYRTNVRAIMQQAFFVIPDMNAVRDGHSRLTEIIEDLESGGYTKNKHFYEVFNLTMTAWLVLDAVMKNKEEHE